MIEKIDLSGPASFRKFIKFIPRGVRKSAGRAQVIDCVDLLAAIEVFLICSTCLYRHGSSYNGSGNPLRGEGWKPLGRRLPAYFAFLGAFPYFARRRGERRDAERPVSGDSRQIFSLVRLGLIKAAAGAETMRESSASPRSQRLCANPVFPSSDMRRRWRASGGHLAFLLSE
jgi:hypothetical protein